MSQFVRTGGETCTKGELTQEFRAGGRIRLFDEDIQMCGIFIMRVAAGCSPGEEVGGGLC